MQKPNATDAAKAAKRLRRQICDDPGVYHVDWGNRYGQLVLTVECISRGDEVRVKSMLPRCFDGVPIHTMAPIWRTGELLPELGTKFDAMLSQSWNVVTREGQEETSRFLGTVMQEEDKHWNSLSRSERTAFVAKRISDRRKAEPGFANCGDKFLQD